MAVADTNPPARPTPFKPWKNMASSKALGSGSNAFYAAIHGAKLTAMTPCLKKRNRKLFK